jgi:hypothetical protein
MPSALSWYRFLIFRRSTGLYVRLYGALLMLGPHVLNALEK